MNAMLDRLAPARDVDRLFDEVDRLVTEGFSRARAFPRRPSARPAIDLYDTGTELVVKALLPGAKTDEVDLSIEQNTLLLQGVSGYALGEAEAKHVTWYRREIGTDHFAEIITLPVAVEPEQATAAFADGVLTVTMPKVAQARSKRIPIQGRQVLAGRVH